MSVAAATAYAMAEFTPDLDAVAKSGRVERLWLLT